jgi:predicted transcriptional regulator
MGKAKFDRAELARLIREGKSQTEIAEIFGVSKMAISKAAKEVGLAVVRHVAARQAPEVVREHINASQQLLKVNRCANELLDLLMAWHRGDNVALQILESQVSRKKVRIGNKEEFINEYKFKDPRELAIKIMDTIKGQLSLQLEILKTMYNAEAFEEFEETVLRVMERMDPKARDEIILEIQKAQPLRGNS